MFLSSFRRKINRVFIILLNSPIIKGFGGFLRMVKKRQWTRTPADLLRALEKKFAEKWPHLPDLDSFPAHPKPLKVAPQNTASKNAPKMPKPKSNPPRKPYLTYSQVDLDRVDRLEKQHALQEQARKERAALRDKDLH
jgi:hypothetical protein